MTSASSNRELGCNSSCRVSRRSEASSWSWSGAVRTCRYGRNGTQPPHQPRRDPLAGFRLLTSVPGAGDQVTYRFEPAVQTQVVVVWLTALPADGDGYQGGVADVALLS